MQTRFHFAGVSIDVRIKYSKFGSHRCPSTRCSSFSVVLPNPTLNSETLRVAQSSLRVASARRGLPFGRKIYLLTSVACVSSHSDSRRAAPPRPLRRMLGRPSGSDARSSGIPPSPCRTSPSLPPTTAFSSRPPATTARSASTHPPIPSPSPAGSCATSRRLFGPGRDASPSRGAGAASTAGNIYKTEYMQGFGFWNYSVDAKAHQVWAASEGRQKGGPARDFNGMRSGKDLYFSLAFHGPRARFDAVMMKTTCTPSASTTPSPARRRFPRF